MHQILIVHSGSLVWHIIGGRSASQPIAKRSKMLPFLFTTGWSLFGQGWSTEFDRDKLCVWL